jgi:putative AlgH/UPF0301 family transcriptional regulator
MRSPWSPKALQKELEKDQWLLLSFAVAKELGMTLTRLWAEVTPEELIGWSCYFGYLNDQQEAAMKRTRRR